MRVEGGGGGGAERGVNAGAEGEGGGMESLQCLLISP